MALLREGGDGQIIPVPFPTGTIPPGAILALLNLNQPDEVKKEVMDGVKWLFSLQNRDGGFPTFSRGWGKLPFDQSCADLTGHCFLALATVAGKYKHELPGALSKKIAKTLANALKYLQKNQKNNGSWLPLWFGNQHTPTHTNPVYGTARVCSYLNDSLSFLSDTPGLKEIVEGLTVKAEDFLVEVQNTDGSWGGDKGIAGTIEETALVISALRKNEHKVSREKGFEWLGDYFKTHGLTTSPIGLYFASLWYDEKMYPLTFYLDAITRELDGHDRQVDQPDRV